MSIFSCPRCGIQNIADSRFCSNCGAALVSVAPMAWRRNPAYGWVLVVLLFAFIAAVMVGFTRVRQVSDSQNLIADSRVSNRGTVNHNVKIPTPALTDTQKVQRAKTLITDEATTAQLSEALELLKSVPKNAKEYRQSEKLVTSAARIILEREIIGVKPISSPFDGGVSSVRSYLKQVINDYDSSEFVEWSPVSKVYVRKEPYWTVQLRIRAKNAFGAYIVKDAVFYIRQGQVVKSEGL